MSTSTVSPTRQPNGPPPDARPRRKLYRGRTLVALSAAYAGGVVLVMADPTSWNGGTAQNPNGEMGVVASIGIAVLIAVTVVVAVCDWRGLASLNGAIKWSKLKTWQIWLLGYFYLCVSPFATPVYLVQAFNTYRQAKQAEPLQQRLHVARLEADLGIMPATEGTCPSCGKPMQVGAEFCVYCGKTLVAKPKVCPACGTTAFPDARWCPTCRTQLPDDSAS